MCLDFLDDIPVCDMCGLNYDELVITKLVLVSGDFTNRLLCKDCIEKIRRYVK